MRDERIRPGLRRVSVAGLAVAVAVAGCATASKDIASTYVSPMQYQQYDCDQLAAEADRIQRRVLQLGGRLDEAAKNDQILTGVGLVLFWPVLFALGGTKEQEAEYARLKGEYDAVQMTAVLKKCPGTLTAAAAEAAASAASGAAGAGPAAAPAAPASAAP